jgi:hypothetical protein
MTQMAQISRNNTAIIKGEDYVAVVLHRTPVVKVGDGLGGVITLNSGGWRTPTTKTRMNQVANAWELGFNVYQKDFEWYVSMADGEVREFADGMTFARNES